MMMFFAIAAVIVEEASYSFLRTVSIQDLFMCRLLIDSQFKEPYILGISRNDQLYCFMTEVKFKGYIRYLSNSVEHYYSGVG